MLKPLKSLQYIWLEKNACINKNAKQDELKKLKKEIRKFCRLGGTECQKLPRAFTKWNETKPVDNCEAIKIYRFKPKPRHELIKLEREKAADERKEHTDYLNLVEKICENNDEIYRFFETIYYEKIESDDPDIVWAKNDVYERKIIDGLVSVKKDKKKKWWKKE